MATPTAKDPFGIRDQTNTIRKRIDEYAQQLVDKINEPRYEVQVGDTFGAEVFHLAFSDTVCDEKGKCWPANDAEWLEVRDDEFASLFEGHAEERVFDPTVAYPNPMAGCAAAVCATLCDLVANRAIELNGSDDLPS